jgi:SPP1 gp7 family putative phage head morphogenesis protein
MADVFEIKFNTPFEKAREAAKRRGVVLPSEYYGKLPKEMRSLTNTISYIQSVEQIQTILDDLKVAIDNGNSFEKWRKNFNPEQFGITKAHAETVYRNALQTQYSVGRWEQAQMAKKTHPYLRYVTINDGRTSQCCRALSGIIRKIDDPFWSSHTPPNHHRCRSIVVSLTEKEAQKRSPAMVGLNQPESPEMQPQKGWDYNPALSHQAQMSSLLEKKISAMPNASNWFKNTVREQATKKLEGLLGVVESPTFEQQMIEKAMMLETLSYETALKQVKQDLESAAFVEFFNGEFKGNYPVGVLSESDQELLNAKTKTVLLSRESLDEHKEKHPEIGLEDYKKIVDIVKSGEIYNSKKKRFVLLHVDGYTYRAAMKVTLDGMENFFLSLIKLQDEKADKEIRKKFERIR